MTDSTFENNSNKYLNFWSFLNYRSPIRAIASALGGIALVVWPSTSLDLIVKAIAVVIIASGIISFIVSSLERRRQNRSKDITSETFRLVVNIILGLLIFIFSGQLTNIVTLLIGLAILLFGIMQFLSLIGARTMMRLSFWLFLMPLLSIAGGIIIILNPEFARNMTIILIGVSFLVYAISEFCVLGLINRAYKKYNEQSSQSDNDSNDSSSSEYENVKDVEYEKVGD